MRADIVILSKTSTQQLYDMTRAAIASLRASEAPGTFNVILIESYEEYQTFGTYTDCVDVFLQPTEPFNYNAYCSIGLTYGTSNWVALCNNDLIFHEGWFTRILEAHEERPDIKSFSPWNPHEGWHDGYMVGAKNISEGYRIGFELTGWCLVAKREIFNSVKLDNSVSFWYSDNVYAKELQRCNIKHALIRSSNVEHLYSVTLKGLPANEQQILTVDQEAKYLANNKRNTNRIWISMIVKNEESCLQACLESVKEADGIVVVDTGSTDNTISIAKQYTSNVVTSYKWNDNFAEARNYALDNIPDNGDYWILSIDADETLEPGGIQKIREIINDSHAQSLSILLKAQGSKDIFFYPRLFRKGVRWAGVGHEAPTVPSDGVAEVSITFGYSAAHQNDPDRMFRIMTKAVETERSPRNLYYLAREYWYRKNYSVAIMLFQEVIIKGQWKPERADTYLYLARCFWALSRGDEAREACANALLVNANFKEACLFMAELSWEENAIQWRSMASTADNRNVLFIRVI